MEKKLTLKWLIIKLAGVLFAAYSAYNVFIMIRDGKRGLPAEAIVISAFVALLFGVLAVFAWTSGAKNIRFIMVRKAMFIISVLAVIALKLRMAASYISYIDLSQPQTVLYGSTYFLTLAAMLILVAYYAFILKDLMMYPVLSILLPAIAGALFLSCLVFEIILFFGFGIGVEANMIRTVVMRPVFYLGFILLSVYFLFPRGREIVEENPVTDVVRVDNNFVA